MTQDRENLIVEITQYLESQRIRSLSSEEIAILLVSDVVGPYFDKIVERFTLLAYTHKSQPV